MGVKRSVGSFVQSIFFGGTHEDLAFEVQVLKKEVAELKGRLDGPKRSETQHADQPDSEWSDLPGQKTETRIVDQCSAWDLFFDYDGLSTAGGATENFYIGSTPQSEAGDINSVKAS